MAYQALARKWRPRNFSEVVGQEHVVKALTHALEFDRMHHAYLFTGTRGVGKTTIARILAKALNCKSRTGFNPCGECLVCREVDEGRFVDLIEVDAASRTKVEDTRDLLENVQYAPSQGHFKVYIIDEVHMLSGHSFNALLKTLEEPPAHVKFLLATTDPQKIPITVLSRCLQFNLKRLTPEQIRTQMEAILRQEDIGFEQSALRSLARAADGSMRDGLSLLDQAIAHGGGSLVEATVSAMLGMVARKPVFDLLAALAAGNAETLLERISAVAELAPNFADVLQQMLLILHHTALAQWAPDAVRHDEDADQVMMLASQLSAEDVQLFYQIGLIGQRDLPLAPEPRSGFEMVLLRMLAFRPAGIEGSEPLAPGRDATARSVVPQIPRSDAPKVVSHPAEPKLSRRDATPIDASVPYRMDEKPGTHVAAPDSSPSPPTLPPAPEGDSLVDTRHPSSVAVAEPPPAASSTPDWPGLIRAMRLGGLTRELAHNCVLVAIEGDRCVLSLDPRSARIRTSQVEAKLEKALQDYFRRPLKLTITLEASTQETPALQLQRHREERQRAAELEIEQDENIRALKQHFDAWVIPGSIKPLD